MQQCLICGSCIALELASYAEHYRQHERKHENIQLGQLNCGFCDSEYPNVEGLLYHLIAYHQVSQPRNVVSFIPKLTAATSGSNSMATIRSVNVSTNNSFMGGIRNDISSNLINSEKKVDEALKVAKEKIIEKLQEIIQDYKNNIYISDHVSTEISKSLIDSTSLTIQLLRDVVKACSSQNYSDKISKLRDDILLSFTDNSEYHETPTSIKQESPISSIPGMEPISEFSLDPLPSTSSSSTPNNAAITATTNEISFDPITFSKLFNNKSFGGGNNEIALDPSKSVKEGLKSLSNEMLNECQEFYDTHTPKILVTFCDIDVYAQFDSPLGRLILYVLSNDTNPNISKDLINIANKESYGYLRNILRATKPSLDYRPKEMEPLVNGFLTIIGKEGPNNEITQAEMKKTLHAWIRSTRYRNKDNDQVVASNAIINNSIIMMKTAPSLVSRKRKLPSDETIESLAQEAQTLITDLEKIKELFRRSASLRLDWIANTPGVDMDAVIKTFPVIQMFPKQLIDIDYEELCLNKKWGNISVVDEMQRIFPALKYLLHTYNVTTLPSDLNQNDSFANIFLSFPSLFHHFLNNSKKIAKQFYYEIAALDFQSGVNQIKNENQDVHNFIGRIETSNGQKIIFVYINGYSMRIEGSLIEALEFYYRIHSVFRIEFPPSFFFLFSWLDLLCKKKVETNSGPQRFMREIERLCKQYQDFPNSRSPSFF